MINIKRFYCFFFTIACLVLKTQIYNLELNNSRNPNNSMSQKQRMGKINLPPPQLRSNNIYVPIQ